MSAREKKSWLYKQAPHRTLAVSEISDKRMEDPNSGEDTTGPHSHTHTHWLTKNWDGIEYNVNIKG